MTARELRGAPVAAKIREDTTRRLGELKDRGVAPKLTVLTATDDEASAWYVRSIVRAGEKIGLRCDVADLGPAAGGADIGDALWKLSQDPAVHGIILQTPLPQGVSAVELAGAIDTAKDVDGANPLSLGRLVAGRVSFAPATAEAAVAVLDHYEVPLAGRDIVVVGRSTVVGKPVAHLLLDRNATVTICHSRTTDLAAHTRSADVLVVAAGRRGIITAEHVKPGATVIDVGTNPDDDGGITGDADASVAEVAGALTPVPGGVGPVTTALLLAHTVRAAQLADLG